MVTFSIRKQCAPSVCKLCSNTTWSTNDEETFIYLGTKGEKMEEESGEFFSNTMSKRCLLTSVVCPVVVIDFLLMDQ